MVEVGPFHLAAHLQQRTEHALQHAASHKPGAEHEQHEEREHHYGMVHRIGFELIGVVGIGGADDCYDAASVAHQRSVHAPEATACGSFLLDIVTAGEKHDVAVGLRLDAAVYHVALEHCRRGAHKHHAVGIVQGDVGVGVVAHVFNHGEHILVAKVCSALRSADAGRDAGRNGVYLLRHQRAAVLLIAVVHEENAHQRHADKCKRERKHDHHVQPGAEIATLESALSAAFPFGRKTKAKEEHKGDEDARHAVEQRVDGAARHYHRFGIGHHIYEMGEAALADEFVATGIHCFGKAGVHLHRIGVIAAETQQPETLVASVCIAGRDEHLSGR